MTYPNAIIAGEAYRKKFAGPRPVVSGRADYKVGHSFGINETRELSLKSSCSKVCYLNSERKAHRQSRADRSPFVLSPRRGQSVEAENCLGIEDGLTVTASMV